MGEDHPEHLSSQFEVITSADVQVGDRLRISHPNRAMFGIHVDRIHDTDPRTVAGRQIKLDDPNVVLNRQKVSLLRHNTSIERYAD